MKVIKTQLSTIPLKSLRGLISTDAGRERHLKGGEEREEERGGGGGGAAGGGRGRGRGRGRGGGGGNDS